MNLIRKNGDDTDRDQKGRFAPGNRGKPRGAKNLATRVAAELLEGGVKDVAAVVVEAARAGDLMAARIVLDKLIPTAKERRIELPDLPDTSSAAGVSRAQQHILNAVVAGVITPSEANKLSGIVEARRRAIETQELDARIAALETNGKPGGPRNV